MTDPARPHDRAVANRRARLKLWIDEHFDGSQTAFIASTNDGKTQVNQGELSGLLRNKSFGEKRARRLEEQAGMPAGYLDSPPGTEAARMRYQVEEPEPNELLTRRRISNTAWPFRLVTTNRLDALRRKLGERLASEAFLDIDRYLDVLVSKWEQEASAKKRQAGPP